MHSIAIASTGAVQQDIHRYEVSFRVLPINERKRLLERDVEQEVSRVVLLDANNQQGFNAQAQQLALNTVTESISKPQSSNSSLCGDPTVASHVQEIIAGEAPNKRMRIGEDSSPMSDKGLVKDSISPSASLDQILNGIIDQQKGPSSVMAEIGSSKTTETTAAVVESMAQEDVLQMFLNRSPLLEEDNSQPKAAVVSQDYQLMAMGVAGKSASQDKSIENSLENPFKEQNDEQGGGKQQLLRKRDLKALERQQQQQQYSKIVTEKQIIRVTEEVLLPENVHIQVKDKETLNLYEAWIAMPDQKHIAKLTKWLQTRKYTCHEHVTDDKLTLKAKLFNFTLYTSQFHPQLNWYRETSPHTYLLEEVKSVQRERKNLLKDLKLFQYFLFNVCPPGGELQKWLSRIPQTQLDRYVNDPEQLFIKKQAIGRVQNGQNSLVFSEEMCFDEEPQRYPNVFADKLYVYTESDGEFRVFPLKRRELQEDAIESCEGGGVNEWEIMKIRGYRYRYLVGASVQQNECYTVYFPKFH
ncbi:hypothetical protein FGO68_gene14938 [Halteria grandinella]|uniref:Uncharacterized protein n=1 Tax=Halteria grandinella TaxID=5974 RepID=A0A8J8T3C2_HALGN|nr:hypothetical protein FGO68_gene14938 [Halteria grandinella]